MQQFRLIIGRVAHRLRWEIYASWVVAKRLILDALCSPQRQARLVRELVSPQLTASPPASPGAADRVCSVDAPVAIEPTSGYVVAGKVSVLEDSLFYSEDVRSRSQRKYFSGVPTVPQLLRRRTTSSVDRVATVRHPYDSNYFHAVVECLGAVALLADQGLLRDRTLVIGPGLSSTAVFRHAADSGQLRDVDWRVQGEEWLVVRDDVVFARPALSLEGLRRTAAFLTADLPRRSVESDRRLFITRPQSVGRSLTNETELVHHLASRGFEVVDPGSMSWPDQVALFRSARQVVGIHGAALTNIIFRDRGRLDVIELHAPNRFEDNFQVLAGGLGFSHWAVPGRGGQGRSHWSDFEADIEGLLNALGEADSA